MSGSDLPSLAVIIANYNHAAFIGEALDAFANQTVAPNEIIVVDDCSTDNSLDVLADYQKLMSNLRIIRNDRNLGTVLSSRIGTDAAHSDCIHLAGADDRIAPTFVEKSLRVLALHPEAGFSFTEGYFFGDTDRHWNGQSVLDQAGYLTPSALAEASRHPRFEIPTWTMVFRRERFLSWGGLRPEFGWNCDWFAAYLVGLTHGACFIPEALAHYRMNSMAYGGRSVTDKEAQIGYMELILRELSQPSYDDVRDLFYRYGVIGRFPYALGAVRRSGVRSCYTPDFIRHVVFSWLRLHWHRVVPSNLRPAFRALLR